jgi:hypothetical protein
MSFKLGHAQNNIRRNFWNVSDPIVEAMHSEFSGRNRSVDFISTSVNEGYYIIFFWNFPERTISETSLGFNNRSLLVVVNG